MRSHRILPVAYDGNGEQDTNIVGSNSEAFSCKKRFLILSSKPIPKYSKCYMEFTITYHPTNIGLRHLPFYVGIHQEPSLGFLVSDFCLGSVYYCNPYLYRDKKDFYHPLNFQAIERYKHNAETTITENKQKLRARIPMINTVIGIAVDTNSNTITIYSDGAKLYSFTPQEYKINTNPGRFFFCICNLLDDEAIKGRINYGRTKLQYKPEGYWSLYEYYYDKIPSEADIDGKLHYGTIYTNPAIQKDAKFTFKCENNIAPIDLSKTHKREPYLIYSDESLRYTTNKSMILRNSSNDIATLCWPIPTNQKIYMELSTQGCVFNLNEDGYPDYVGVPVLVGITNTINNNVNDAFWIELDHQKHYDYFTHSNVSGNYKTYKIENILTPVIPIQPQNIGLLFDLQHNKISIYTNGDLFCEVPIKGTDYSDPYGLYYFFIRPHDTVFTVDPNAADKEHTILNTGETEFDYKELVDNKEVMSYYYYYNYLIKEDIEFYFNCEITTRPYKLQFGKSIPATLYVPDTKINSEWSPGLNKLYNTYNTVSDIEEHKNVRDISAYDMYKLIQEELITNKR